MKLGFNKKHNKVSSETDKNEFDDLLKNSDLIKVSQDEHEDSEDPENITASEQDPNQPTDTIGNTNVPTNDEPLADSVSSDSFLPDHGLRLPDVSSPEPELIDENTNGNDKTTSMDMDKQSQLSDSIVPEETDSEPEIEAFVADWFLNDIVATDLNDRILSAIHTIASPKLKSESNNEHLNFVASELVDYFKQNGRYLIDVINKFSVDDKGNPNWQVVNQTKYDNSLLLELINPNNYATVIKIPAVLRLVQRIQRGELELTPFTPIKKVPA